MARKTYLERYIDYFSVQTGGAPKRERLEWAIQETLTDNDLKLFFVLPAYGSLSPEKFENKARRAGFSKREYEESARHLHEEGFLISYDHPKKGRVYERAFVSFTVEQQVRRRRGTPVGAAYGEFWEGMAELTAKMPSNTPYFRVLPVEATLSDNKQSEVVPINVAIEDPRQVLPIDVISEMVSKEPLIGVSECYGRLAKDNRGEEPCTYPRETCFTFNELAQTLIETGLARQVDAQEAIEILRDAEAHGLIHNADNCQEHMKALCNCCPCCCPAIKSFKAGVRNVNAASRYMPVLAEEQCVNCGTCVEICPLGAVSSGEKYPVFNIEKCIGCGLCVSHCPQGAIQMQLRGDLPQIPENNDRLWSSIRREALFTMVKEKLFRRK
jgi:Pyruvate/2-oxoacid:ferredoxin oxidoreductase delta subunit